jgi:hypothetical protein
VIVLAVRWYLRFNLSYRDVEELLAERGIQVDHVTLYRWVQRSTPACSTSWSASAWHHVEQYANNPIEADHGWLTRKSVSEWAGGSVRRSGAGLWFWRGQVAAGSSGRG